MIPGVKIVSRVLFLACSLTVASINAQEPDVAAELEGIARVIESGYYDAERAAEIAGLLRSPEIIEQLEDVEGRQALSQAVTRLLLEHDRHFSVQYVGDQAPQEQAGFGFGDPAEFEASMRRANFGFAEVKILPGNIGYIDLHQFAPIGMAEKTARAALDFISGTDAVIFDMRKNGGGEPSMVQFLISHFLDPSEPVVINTFVSRSREYPDELKSLPFHPSGFRPDVPLMVLTGPRSGSAGEAFPYHLQALDRATIIGETTYGAGNPGEFFMTESGYQVFVSTGSARNPITGTNWEGAGVTPDVPVDAADALEEALVMLYADMAKNADSPAAREEAEWARELLAAELEPISLSEEELALYAGEYGIRSFSAWEGSLVYVRDGGEPQGLVALGNHRFALEGDNVARFIFATENGDPASELVVHMGAMGQFSFPRTK